MAKSNKISLEDIINLISSLKKDQNQRKIFLRITKIAQAYLDLEEFEIWSLREKELFRVFAYKRDKENLAKKSIKISEEQIKSIQDDKNSIFNIIKKQRNASSSIIIKQINEGQEFLIFIKNKKPLSQEDKKNIEKVADLIATLYNLKDEQHKDFHTNLYNKGSLGHVVRRIAQRKQKEIGLIFIDLNNFKKINDTFGHSVGDKEIIEFSRILKENIRADDHVIRTGGDEFLILFNNGEENNAIRIIKRIEESYENHVKKTKYIDMKTGRKKALSSLNIGISYGIEEINCRNIRDLEEKIREAIEKSEKKMYDMKENKKKKIQI
ncbi:MAG: two-component system, cell cycle response regulator [Candidatus Woesearchaeota archaeon]|nr:two-component system, cell cycle response regulator [Candidatus Woesearchaeota archaeon]